MVYEVVCRTATRGGDIVSSEPTRPDVAIACETCRYPGPSGHFETCALFDENDPAALTEREAE